MKKNMITVSGVHKTFYNQGAPAHILDDISFEIKKGEIVTLLGKSGCGKSTLLNMVGGFESIDRGEILLEGRGSETANKEMCHVVSTAEFIAVAICFEKCGIGTRRRKITSG